MFESHFLNTTQFASSFFSTTALRAYELDREFVRSNGKIRPFDAAQRFARGMANRADDINPVVLQLSGLRLAHAVMKTDRLRRLPFERISTVGIFLEILPVLDWRREELRLRDGISTAYAEFVGASLAGRLGQGIALLLMEHESYAYTRHFHRSQNQSGPDFIFESNDESHSRAFVEAKGSFVRPGETPPIKGKLREGLAQVDAGAAPDVEKSFVSATFLREVNDSNAEPSLVAFVDQEADDAGQPNSPLSDEIRRHNYAAWLDIMGFNDAASDLRVRETQRAGGTSSLLRLKYRDADFAVVVLGTFSSGDLRQLHSAPWFWPGGQVLIAGVNVPVLEKIESVLKGASGDLTFEKEDETRVLKTGVLDEERFKVSILSDGSLLGVVSWETVMKADLMEFAL